MRKTWISIRHPVWLLLAWPIFSNGQSVCNTLRPLTVRIDSGGPTGAGVIVAGDSKTFWIATSGHVVENAAKVRVFFWDEPKTAFPARLEYRRRIEMGAEDDIAFLTVISPRLAPPPLPLRSEPPVEAERVSYAGHPGELEWQCYPNNQVISRLDYGESKELFLFTNPASQPLHGLSGGPVSDAAGNLLGIIFGQISGNSSAIKISVVLALLSKEFNLAPARTVRLSKEPASGDVPSFDCSSASPEQMRLAISARATDRVLGMWHCRPENVVSSIVKRSFAELLNATEFPTSRPFLDRLLASGWNVIVDIAPKNVFARYDYGSSPVYYAIRTANTEGLKWLAANTPREYWKKYPSLIPDLDYSAVDSLEFAVTTIGLLRGYGVPADYNDYEGFRNAYTKWIETQYPRSNLPSARPSDFSASARMSASRAVFGPGRGLEAPDRAARWKAISDALAPEDQMTLQRVRGRTVAEFADPRITELDRDIKDFSDILVSPQFQWWHKVTTPGQFAVSYAKVPKNTALRDEDIGNACGEAPGSDALCPFYNVKKLRDELEFDKRLRAWLENLRPSK